MLKELIKLANELDEIGLHDEADNLDKIIEEELESSEEDDTEIETINKSVVAGDWIIRAMTRAGEEYSVKKDKFPNLYNTEPVGSGPDGFMIYEVKPDDRTGIVISEAFGETLADSFSDNFPAPQSDIHSWLTENAPTITVRTEKGGAEILSFEAPWGEPMPIKLNDILIINKDEVYRIARAEFDQTYQSIDGE